jgi:hypothetical protein
VQNAVQPAISDHLEFEELSDDDAPCPAGDGAVPPEAIHNRTTNPRRSRDETAEESFEDLPDDSAGDTGRPRLPIAASPGNAAGDALELLPDDGALPSDPPASLAHTPTGRDSAFEDLSEDGGVAFAPAGAATRPAAPSPDTLIGLSRVANAVFPEDDDGVFDELSDDGDAPTPGHESCLRSDHPALAPVAPDTFELLSDEDSADAPPTANPGLVPKRVTVPLAADEFTDCSDEDESFPDFE